jgi:hypothetical protein
VSGIHAGSQQGIALQVDRLPVVGRGNAHVADQHERETLKRMFPYS